MIDSQVRVGTDLHAALILKMHNALDGTYLLSNSGTTRTVYLIDGIVYKVGYSWDNRAEFDNISRKGHLLPEGVYFPLTSLYEFGDRTVIAMEYIEGQAVGECYCDEYNEPHTDICIPKDVLNLVSGIIDDTGGLNVIIKDNGDIYIIDAAA